jgi:hypothetical protein
MTTSIKSASASEGEQAIAVIVLAFGADPVVRWTYPDPHDYLTYWPELVRAFGGKAFDHGTGYYVGGFSGAALWLPPDVHPAEEEMVALLQRTVPERNQKEVFSLLEQMGATTRMSLIGICHSSVSIRPSRARVTARH